MPAGNFVRNITFGGGGGGSLLADVGLLIVRVSFGVYMAVAHGMGKFSYLGKFAEGLAAKGFPAPSIMATMAAVTEFGGGILLALGLATRPVAVALSGAMLVAAFIFHSNDPFYAAPGQASRELALLYLAVFLLFVLAGGGRFAADRFLRKKV
jgi:putative oxidoreductase